MLRATFLCLLCCLSFTVTQLAASPSQPSTPIQIIYTLDGTTLSTYNIDPLTLQATLAGTLTVQASLYGWIYPSSNGHCLYFVTSNGYQSSQQIFVYATDASGVPQNPAVQTVNVNGFGGLQRLENAVRGFVEDQGTIFRAEGLENFAARGGFGREESAETECIGG